MGWIPDRYMLYDTTRSLYTPIFLPRVSSVVGLVCHRSDPLPGVETHEHQIELPMKKIQKCFVKGFPELTERA